MIEFENVRMVYPNGTEALSDVSLKIDEGEFVFIVGASGAGKSTLLHLLLREEKATDGTIRVGDYDLSTIRNRKIPYYRRKLGVVFQDFKLFDHKTVYENVSFAMRAIGAPSSLIRVRVPAILKSVDLSAKYKSFPTELSGGEQQRVSFARAIANNPDIIIADEPTANIDPEMTFEMMNLLLKFNKLGKTVIVITHERGLVNYLKKRVITLDKGRIVDDTKGGLANESL
ncbi:MAG: cell division ATP-binding protein FtsE [Clostridia bacterium]|nr:cell division ATP-binding protein FtsE [Clostridia bacterium]